MQNNIDRTSNEPGYDIESNPSFRQVIEGRKLSSEAVWRLVGNRMCHSKSKVFSSRYILIKFDSGNKLRGNVHRGAGRNDKKGVINSKLGASTESSVKIVPEHLAKLVLNYERQICTQ